MSSLKSVFKIPVSLLNKAPRYGNVKMPWFIKIWNPFAKSGTIKESSDDGSDTNKDELKEFPSLASSTFGDESKPTADSEQNT